MQRKRRYHLAAVALTALALLLGGDGIGKGGTGTLLVDGAKVAEARIPNTICCRFSLDETFDVGEDPGTPVVEDYAAKMPFRFTGKLEKVTIELK